MSEVNCQLVPAQAIEIIPIRSDRFCRTCGENIQDVDKFCGRCGSELHGKVAALTRPNEAHPTKLHSTTISVNPAVEKLLSSRVLVIGAIALVGPLGLPALWFSNRFSQTTKLVLTALFLILTIVLPLAMAWYWLEYSIRPFVDAFPSGTR